MTALEKLVTSWLENPPTERSRIVHLNIQLWRAVAEDHIEKSRKGIITSPTQDPKVKYAVMLLEKLNGERKSICPHIEAAARFVLNLPITSNDGEQLNHPTGKAAAANDK